MLHCTGAIRQEEGNIAYEISYGAGGSINWHETWSSIRSLYRSIYVYPTVGRVFFSERFRSLSQNHTVEGPFKVFPWPMAKTSNTPFLKHAKLPSKITCFYCCFYCLQEVGGMAG